MSLTKAFRSTPCLCCRFLLDQGGTLSYLYTLRGMSNVRRFTLDANELGGSRPIYDGFTVLQWTRKHSRFSTLTWTPVIADTLPWFMTLSHNLLGRAVRSSEACDWREGERLDMWFSLTARASHCPAATDRGLVGSCARLKSGPESPWRDRVSDNINLSPEPPSVLIKSSKILVI